MPAKEPEQPIRTFDETFASHRLTPPEREQLVWHLAYMRARKTIQALLPTTDPKLVMGFDPKDVLRGDSSRGSEADNG